MRRSTILTILVSAAACFAQSPKKQAFEVASIKPSDPNARGGSSHVNRRFVTIKNWTLKRLVERAYDVEDYQVTGGPNWLDTYGFDISAKVDDSEEELQGKEGQQRLMAMFQSLLVERFQLQFHRETKTLPVYNLLTAKNGFKLTAVAGDGNQSMSNNGARLTSKGVDMPALAVFLARTMERPVQDATAIAGVFDFTLEWSPVNPSGKAPDGNEAAGPSIFTALQEQLGLRLEAAKGPVEIIVVEHAEKPTEN